MLINVTNEPYCKVLPDYIYMNALVKESAIACDLRLSFPLYTV